MHNAKSSARMAHAGAVGACAHETASERLARLGGRVADLSTKELGSLGEDLAAEMLEAKGYEIVERNWTCLRGEADIVCRDGDQSVLVEVKTRLRQQGADGPLWPELAVGAAKRRRYEGIASCYALHADAALLRFDIVAVSVSCEGTAYLHHIEAAFGREA